MSQAATPEPVHPRAQHQLFGHEKARAELVSAVNSGRLHHAWLIEGPRGIGKATLAFRFAKALAAARGGLLGADLPAAQNDRAVHLIETGVHPDVTLLERPWDEDKKRFKADLPVEQVRGLAKFFATHATDGGWRVAIIDAVDDMNWNACNALLKLLEEPPAGGLLLLVSHAPGRLMATIKSRCRRLQLRPLDAGSMEQGLIALAPQCGTTARAQLAVMSGGSLGRALDILARDGLSLAARMGSLEKPAVLDVVAQHALADELAKAANEGTFDLFLSLAEDLLIRGAGGAISSDTSAGATGLARANASVEALARLRRLTRLEDSLHLDRKYVALAVLNELAGLAQPAAKAG